MNYTRTASISCSIAVGRLLVYETRIAWIYENRSQKNNKKIVSVALHLKTTMQGTESCLKEMCIIWHNELCLKAPSIVHRN